MLATPSVTTSRPSGRGFDEAVATLASSIEARHDQLDGDCRLPGSVFDELKALGLFRQLVPTELGGRGDTPLDWFRRGAELARMEPSLAWVVTQGAAEMGWISAGGAPEWSAQVLADPSAASASTVAGLGSLSITDGVATLSGSWSFNSGCQGATWIGGLALVEGDEPGGAPLRMCWVPADQATVIEDWDALGLRGTGSHSIRIDAQEIPMAWTVDLFSPTTNELGPYCSLVGNGNWPIAGAVAATQLGNARRALDEVRTLVVDKAPAPTFVPLAKNSAVQRQLTELEGVWLAATASVERELELLWQEACDVGHLSTERRWRLATSTAHANRAALDVVDGACQLAATAVTAQNHRLSRCLRDAHALRGHISTGAAVIELAAQVSLGQASPNMLV